MYYKASCLIQIIEMISQGVAKATVLSTGSSGLASERSRCETSLKLLQFTATHFLGALYLSYAYLKVSGTGPTNVSLFCEYSDSDKRMLADVVGGFKS